MLSFFTNGIGLRIAKWGAVIVTVLLILAKVRQSGRTLERVEGLQRRYDNVVEAKNAKERARRAIDRGDIPDGVLQFYIE